MPAKMNFELSIMGRVRSPGCTDNTSEVKPSLTCSPTGNITNGAENIIDVGKTKGGFEAVVGFGFLESSVTEAWADTSVTVLLNPRLSWSRSLLVEAESVELLQSRNVIVTLGKDEVEAVDIIGADTKKPVEVGTFVTVTATDTLGLWPFLGDWPLLPLSAIFWVRLYHLERACN